MPAGSNTWIALIVSSHDLVAGAHGGQGQAEVDDRAERGCRGVGHDRDPAPDQPGQDRAVLPDRQAAENGQLSAGRFVIPALRALVCGVPAIRSALRAQHPAQPFRDGLFEDVDPNLAQHLLEKALGWVL
jgi:hypothetical protein